jgi:two-component system, NtrC family, nitrogen regulation sensor histidine kinase NtrY
LKKRYYTSFIFWIGSLIAILIVLGILSFFEKPTHNSKTIETAAINIGERIEKTLQAFDINVNTNYFEKQYLQNNDNFIKDRNYTIVISNNKELVYWSNNKYIYSLSNQQDSIPLSFKQKNIDFVYYKRVLPSDSSLFVAIYIPIKYDYLEPSNILTNTFINNNRGSAEWRLTKNLKPSDIPIKVRGIALLGIDANNTFTFTEIEDYRSELLLVLPILLLLICLHNIFIIIAKNKHGVFASIGLITAIILLRFANYHFNFPVNYLDFYLFSPKYFTVDAVFRSLGDTILNSLLLIYIFWFVRLHFNKLQFNVRNNISFYFYALLILLATLLQFKLYCVACVLVENVNMPFGPTLLENINENLLLGFLALASLFFAMFQIMLLIVRIGEKCFKLSFKNYFNAIWIAILLFCTCLKIIHLPILTSYYYFILIIFSGYLSLHFKSFLFSVNPFGNKLYALVLIITIVITGFVFVQQHTINYNLYKSGSVNLLPQRDLEKETQLDSLAREMQADNSLILHKHKNQWNANSMNRYLQNKYFINLFSDKNFKFSIIQNGKILMSNSNKSQISLDNIFERSEKTNSLGLVSFRKNKRGMDAYLIKLNQPENTKFYIELKKEKFNEAKNDPPIWEDKNKSTELLLKSTKYKLVTNNKILYKSKYFEEPPGIDLLQSSDSIFHINKIAYYKYKLGEDKTIVFANKFISPLKLLSLFGFGFVFIFIIVIGVLIVFSFIISGGKFLLFAKFIKLNLRVRVLAAQLFLQLLTFSILLIVGVTYNRTTVNKKNSDLYTETNAQLESAIVSSSVLQDYNNLEGDTLPNIIISVLDSIQKTTQYNFDLFKADGKLLYSSTPKIYLDNYRSSFVMPSSLDSNMDQITEKVEHINSYTFLGTYKRLSVLIMGKPVYLHIPFYNILENTKKELLLNITNYFNIFVLIFLLTTLVSYLSSMFFSRSLTRLAKNVGSLTVSSESKHTNMQWPYYDEVRILVDQYHKVEKELKVSIAKLTEQERDNAWREMAKQVAHEIKNPITPIKLSLQNMLRRMDKVENEELKNKLTASIDSVLQQIESLNNIATSFGDFAEIAKEKNQILDVNTELRMQINLLKNNADNVKIIEKLNDTKMELFMDRDHFKRVINNLILNAIQAVQDAEKGVITIESSFVPTSNQVIITITDNGLGIPAEIQEKIFYANFTTKASGKGLGLAMCKDIINLMNGTISFTSKQGVGTSFIISLPLAK